MKDMMINLKKIGEVVWTGFASFSSQFMMFIAIIFTNNLLQSYGGGLHVAAFTIQNGYITNLLALAALGGMTGLQPIISYNYGAGNLDRVKQAIKMGLIFTVSFFVIVTAILVIFADPIVSFFPVVILNCKNWAFGRQLYSIVCLRLVQLACLSPVISNRKRETGPQRLLV